MDFFSLKHFYLQLEDVQPCLIFIVLRTNETLLLGVAGVGVARLCKKLTFGQDLVKLKIRLSRIEFYLGSITFLII